MRIDSGDANPFAALVAGHLCVRPGLLNIDANGGTFTLLTEASGSTRGDFVVLQSALLLVSNDDTLALSGRMDVEGPVTVDPGSLLLNDGNVNVLLGCSKLPLPAVTRCSARSPAPARSASAPRPAWKSSTPFRTPRRSNSSARAARCRSTP